MGEGAGTGPVEYGRDDYGVTLDAHDRSKNSPTALGGYTIEIRPEDSWPGLDGADTELQFDPVRMQTVAGALDTLHGLVASVPRILPPADIRFGAPSWQEANDLAAAARMVTDAVNKYSTNLINNIQTAKDAIAASATRNGRAEEAAGTGVHNAGSGLAGNA